MTATCHGKDAASRTPRKLLATLALALSTALPCNTVQAQEGISGAEARDAVQQLLQVRGLSPAPGLGYDDYINVHQPASADDSTYLTLYINADGALIPTPDWQKYHPEFCKGHARYQQQATQRLQFQLVRTREVDGDLTRDQTFVFASTANAQTNIKTEQREAGDTRHWTGKGSATRLGQASASDTARTMNDALEQLAYVPQEMTGACGDVHVTHVSGNLVNKPASFRAGYQGSSNPSLSYTWNFGDGSIPSTGDQQGQHVYGEPGSYTVVVRVEGGELEPASGQVTVKIKDEDDEDEAAAAHIQPLDGLWTIELVKLDLPQCPSDVAARIRPMARQMISSMQGTRDFSFDTPFHPKPLMDKGPPLRWQRLGANRWHAVLAQAQSGAVKSKVTINLDVASPTRMTGIENMHIPVMAPSSIRSGQFKMEYCVAVATFEYTRDE